MIPYIFDDRLRSAALCGCLLLLCNAGSSQPLSDKELSQISFEQKMGAQLPLELSFVDETGRPVHLRDYFGTKPVVLVPGYYGCPMLCTLVLNGLVETMQDMKWRVGEEFEVINVSISPQETPALAAAKKETYLKRYGRVDAADGWHFLTGNQVAIRALTETVGFDYRFDPATQQYAHPSGLVVITPQGKVSHYLFGVSFSSRDLYGALKEASSEQVGSPVRRLLLLCFHYNPLTGKYSPAILSILRFLAAATVLGLLGFIVASVRRPKSP